ncbi:MAG: hypothetical protein OXG49_14840 [Chloroflexi bacterium]|nr:hypothetical protein [Chloroflexota bacterium]
MAARKAEKLLKRMRRSKSGWKRRDLETLYEGFGFILKHGAKHDYYQHPEYPKLRDTLKRSRTVSEYSVRNAIGLIERLKKCKDANYSDED